MSVNLAPIRKAVVAAVGAGVSAFGTGIGEPLVVHHSLSSADVLTAVGLGIVAACAVGKGVHATRNRPA